MLKWGAKPIEIRGWVPVVMAVATVLNFALFMSLGRSLAQVLVSPLTWLCFASILGTFAAWQRTRQRHTGGTAT